MSESHPLLRTLRSARALGTGQTRDELRGPKWSQRSYGLVRLANDGTEDPLTLHLADAIGLLTGDSTIGGWASLRLQGNSWFDGLDRTGQLRPVLIHCLRGTQLRRRAGIQPFRGLVHPDELLDQDGFAVTTLARAAFDEARSAVDIREAVVALDMAASTTIELSHTTHRAIARVLNSHHKVRGLVQARAAFELSSTRSASPWESRTRLLAELDAGVRRLQVNVPIFGPTGRLLGIADLLDEEVGFVIESDGADHRANLRHTDDNRREERFERTGLVVSRITSLDHRDRRDTVGRIVAARRDALSASKREWSTVKPDWWWTWPPGRRWD